jgi:hypothetical protein
MQKTYKIKTIDNVLINKHYKNGKEIRLRMFPITKEIDKKLDDIYDASEDKKNVKITGLINGLPENYKILLYGKYERFTDDEIVDNLLRKDSYYDFYTIPTNYDYDKNEITTINEKYCGDTQTFNTLDVFDYFHGLIGKPEYIFIIEEYRNKKRNDEY